MTDGLQPHNDVFISYSHADREWLKRLQVHLKPLERDGAITRWDDTLIKPGTDWRLEIREALERAKVAVLLISADFFASEFITTNELPPLLDAAAHRGTLILSVIVSPSRFERTPSLSRFQTVNPPTLPLILMDKAQQERVFAELSSIVEDALSEERGGRRAPERAIPEHGHEPIPAPGLRQDQAQDVADAILLTPPPEQFPSRWMLQPTRRSASAPIVILPGYFDGIYGEGLPRVELPDDLERLDRAVLPGIAYRRSWVFPQRDWLADALVVLSDPLERENVFGIESYRADRSLTDPPWREAQIALPLKGEFFRWFRPEDIATMLRIEVSRAGEVRVTLDIPVGSESHPRWVRVDRVYSDAQIRRDHIGPQLVVWPPFAADDWTDYALFRLDRQAGLVHPAEALQVQAYVEGRRMAPLDYARRTDVTATYAFDRAPEVLELRAEKSPGLPQQTLGVLIPRYRHVPAPHAGKWQVGVDFGTSHTTVAVYREDAQEEEILRHDDVLLSLTQPSADLFFFLQSFFLPDILRPEPFNTALVHSTTIHNYGNPGRPVAIYTNIPFSGFVRADVRNRVAYNLKWPSSEREEYLAEAFLRTTSALVLARAREEGVVSENVTFTYAYPCAFERHRQETLRMRWQKVLTSCNTSADSHSAAVFDGGKGTADSVPKLGSGICEGHSALRYFLSRRDLVTSGALSLILDVGGGTTELGGFARSKALALDSLPWGARLLVGSRVRRAGQTGFTNTFVRAFCDFALRHGLPPSQQEPLHHYADQGHDELAFSYLLRTRWYRDDGALLFRETPEYGSFRLLILYFFATLFYYTGLLYRAVRIEEAEHSISKVMLAGNGSRFLHWLQRDWSAGAENPFPTTLLEVMAHAADDQTALNTSVGLSSRPKEEVARGLVTPSTSTVQVQLAPSAVGSVVGERIRIEQGGVAAASYEPASLRPSHMEADERVLAGIRWEEGEMEVERFHRVLTQSAAKHLARQGGPWTSAPTRLQREFSDFPGTRLQDATRARLEALVRETGGVPGSLFLVEAAAMLDVLFERLIVSYGGR